MTDMKAVNDFRAEVGGRFICNRCERTRSRGLDFLYIDASGVGYRRRLCRTCTDAFLAEEEGVLPALSIPSLEGYERDTRVVTS